MRRSQFRRLCVNPSFKHHFGQQAGFFAGRFESVAGDFRKSDCPELKTALSVSLVGRKPSPGVHLNTGRSKAAKFKIVSDLAESCLKIDIGEIITHVHQDGIIQRHRCS